MPKVSISHKGTICIYAVLAPTGKIYIGQTWDIYHRYKSGVSKSQRLLYRSCKKYGEENHKLFTIVEFRGAFTQADLDYWERYYIEVYRSEGYQLLNIREGGGNNGKLADETKALISIKSNKWKSENPGKVKEIITKVAIKNTGSKRTSETRKKMSSSAKGKIRSEQHCNNLSNAKKGKPSSFKGKTFSAESIAKITQNRIGKGVKPICQYTLNGDLIKEWTSIKEAAETMGVSTGSIGGCVRKEKHYKTCGGFIWRYKSDETAVVPSEHKQTFNPKECPVIQLDLYGNIIATYESVKEAAELTGTNRTNLIKCCRGSRNKAGGFTWRYK